MMMVIRSGHNVPVIMIRDASQTRTPKSAGLPDAMLE